MSHKPHAHRELSEKRKKLVAIELYVQRLSKIEARPRPETIISY